MRCPNDETTLVMSERNGIEIDYCPDCRGVWLDRGELDKIIERAVPETPVATAPAVPVTPVAPVAPAAPVQQVPMAQPAYDPRYDAGYDRRYDDRRDDRRYDNRGGYDPRYGGQQPQRKKKNWLSELFDD